MPFGLAGHLPWSEAAWLRWPSLAATWVPWLLCQCLDFWPNIAVGNGSFTFSELSASSGVNFINILFIAYWRADPKSVKIQSSCQYLFVLLGSVHLKAACKMLMKSTPGAWHGGGSSMTLQKKIDISRIRFELRLLIRLVRFHQDMLTKRF